MPARPCSKDDSRFVILFHEVPKHWERASHWDLMLQHSQQLRTWALPATEFERGPFQANERVSSERLPDHRLFYLAFEGALLGDRGHVRQWDTGSLTWIIDSADRMKVRLEGVRSSGVLSLLRDDASSAQWTVQWS